MKTLPDHPPFVPGTLLHVLYFKLGRRSVDVVLEDHGDCVEAHVGKLVDEGLQVVMTRHRGSIYLA